MKRAFASIAFVIALALIAIGQGGFNFADLMNVRRVADPQLYSVGQLRTLSELLICRKTA